MSMFTAFNISASGMTAQQLRTDVISQNIANAQTTRTSEGTAYVRKAVVFTEKTLSAATAMRGPSSDGSSFASVLKNARNGILGDGVKVTSIYEDNGYVIYPNVNVVQEMTDLIDASRSYEANISAFNASKTMANKGLTIGQA